MICVCIRQFTKIALREKQTGDKQQKKKKKASKQTNNRKVICAADISYVLDTDSLLLFPPFVDKKEEVPDIKMTRGFYFCAPQGLFRTSKFSKKKRNQVERFVDTSHTRERENVKI